MKVANEVLNVLAAADFSGPRLVLTGQLDRKLYTSTNAVLEAAGGKWDKKTKAHIFPVDAADFEDGQLVEPGCTPAHSRRARAAGSAVWMTTVQSPPTLEPARGVELREVSPRPGRTTVALGLRACRGRTRPTVRR